MGRCFSPLAVGPCFGAEIWEIIEVEGVCFWKDSPTVMSSLSWSIWPGLANKGVPLQSIPLLLACILLPILAVLDSQNGRFSRISLVFSAQGASTEAATSDQRCQRTESSAERQNLRSALRISEDGHPRRSTKKLPQTASIRTEGVARAGPER